MHGSSEVSRYFCAVSIQHGFKIARQVSKKPTPQLVAVELHRSVTALGLTSPTGTGPLSADIAAC